MLARRPRRAALQGHGKRRKCGGIAIRQTAFFVPHTEHRKARMAARRGRSRQDSAPQHNWQAPGSARDAFRYKKESPAGIFHPTVLHEEERTGTPSGNDIKINSHRCAATNPVATICYRRLRKDDRRRASAGLECNRALNPSSRKPPFEKFIPRRWRGFFCSASPGRYNRGFISIALGSSAWLNNILPRA